MVKVLTLLSATDLHNEVGRPTTACLPVVMVPLPANANNTLQVESISRSIQQFSDNRSCTEARAMTNTPVDTIMFATANAFTIATRIPSATS